MIIIALCGIIAGQNLFLLPMESGSPLEGSFSYLFFRTDSLVRVLVSVQLSNNSLQFVTKDNEYIARYKITTAIYDDDELMSTNEILDSVLAKSFSGTNMSDPWQAGKLSLFLNHGKYKLYLILADMNARTKARAEITLKVPDPEKFIISSPWLFITEKDSVLISTRIPANWDSLGVAAEVYDVPESASVKLTIIGLRTRTLSYSGKFTDLDDKKLAIASFPISEMESGEYEAKIEVRSKENKKVAQSKIDFSIILTSGAMYKYHFDELLDQLAIIASPSEIDAIEDADSVSRDSLWEDFWIRRDPSPTTEYNEAKEEFFRRVQYSNEHFGLPSWMGWTTDRGRIYIEYGQPDEIERHPFEINSYPYEIWYYYSLRYTFVFVDRNGDGDYRLHETR